MTPLLAWSPPTNPLGQGWLSAAVAFIPILVMLLTLGVLRWRAHLAGATSWLVAVIVAVAAFGMPWHMALASSVAGFLYGLFPIVFILLAAIWMYQLTVISGRFDDLRRTFFLISDDPRVLGILIAFCFGGLLEALAGFGAPVAIAAAMLIAIGFSMVRAALTALVANTVPVAFGAVGLPVLMAAQTGNVPVLDVAAVTARICAALGLVVPFLLLAIMDGKRGLRECWPFGLFVGAIFGATKIVVASTDLYNLTEVFASVITVALAMVFLRVWKPSGGEEAAARIGIAMEPTIEDNVVAQRTTDAEQLTTRRIVMALVPYLLVVVVFAIAALGPIKALLASANITFGWPLLGELSTAAGEPAAHRSFTVPLLSQPGFLMVLVALAVGVIYRVPAREIFAELGRTAQKMRYSAITIGFVVALAYVMGDSGQTLALGLFVAGAGAAYPFLAPILGWIGTYVTGSDTSANILFSSLQSGVGEQIGADSALGADAMRTLLVGSGAAGGVVGKMISPQSLTIAATAIGLAGGEAAILRRALRYSLVLLVLMCLFAGAMSTPVLSVLVP